MKVTVLASYSKKDETEVTATILDQPGFLETLQRSFDMKYSLKGKYSRIIESFILCRPVFAYFFQKVMLRKVLKHIGTTKSSPIEEHHLQ